MATPLNNQKVYPGIYKNRDGYPMLIKTLSIWVASILPHPTSRKRASKLKTKYHRTKISGGVAANEDPSATLNKFVGASANPAAGAEASSTTPGTLEYLQEEKLESGQPRYMRSKLVYETRHT
ncbi:hypothetical protein M7I_0670 [Glarea lozoyensis 74030]|uniref:Uncharacterized protein n=1 Tax=Glarea lozoyensis (strain ATCC 74030 / MF5533) TaxID=1104152 RepID=H0EE02_GLAL7|nr:hypothetical protein M7I_0670 [Glarea lozoyensis 74030]